MAPALDRLHYALVSGDHGLVKPDPAVFRLLCEKAGMAPGELLFVDDSWTNVEAARALGFHTRHFTGSTPGNARSLLAQFEV
ncbi:MAG TPA: HAD-IA family hydrolase [Caulobacteraceae bacterium]